MYNLHCSSGASQKATESPQGRMHHSSIFPHHISRHHPAHHCRTKTQLQPERTHRYSMYNPHCSSGRHQAAASLLPDTKPHSSFYQHHISRHHPAHHCHIGSELHPERRQKYSRYNSHCSSVWPPSADVLPLGRMLHKPIFQHHTPHYHPTPHCRRLDR